MTIAATSTATALLGGVAILAVGLFAASLTAATADMRRRRRLREEVAEAAALIDQLGDIDLEKLLSDIDETIAAKPISWQEDGRWSKRASEMLGSVSENERQLTPVCDAVLDLPLDALGLPDSKLESAFVNLVSVVSRDRTASRGIGGI